MQISVFATSFACLHVTCQITSVSQNRSIFTIVQRNFETVAQKTGISTWSRSENFGKGWCLGTGVRRINQNDSCSTVTSLLRKSNWPGRICGRDRMENAEWARSHTVYAVNLSVETYPEVNNSTFDLKTHSITKQLLVTLIRCFSLTLADYRQQELVGPRGLPPQIYEKARSASRRSELGKTTYVRCRFFYVIPHM